MRVVRCMGVSHLARLTWTFALVACTRASDPTTSGAPPPPAREPPPAVAPAKPAPIALPITAPSPSTPSKPSTGRFGVRWRVQLPGLDPGTDDTETALVIGNDVFVSEPVLAAVHDEIAVFDLATGAKRRTARLVHTRLVAADGALVATNGDDDSASGGHVVIQDARVDGPSVRILDASGAVRWRGSGAFALVRGDHAYATTQDALTAIELSSNRVLWRRSNVAAIEADDTWLYGMSPAGALQIIDGTTGELAGEVQLGFSSRELVLHGPAIRVGAWLFGLGPLPTPEKRTSVLARGCLIETGCPDYQYAPLAAKVTIDGTTTVTTDRRGCFRAHVTLGLGPAHVEVESATATPIQLDTPFPAAVVFDRAPVTLRASYLEGGCHDTMDLRGPDEVP